MKYVHNDEKWAEALQKEFSEYIFKCYETVDEDVEGFETVSGQPFCGCEVCEGREAIMWLMPRLIDAYRDGIIEEA